jgi:Ras family
MPTSTFMPQNEPLCIKLLVLGTASVGKSSLLLRFTDQQWLPEGERIPTIGVDTLVKLLTCVNGRSGSLTLASFQVHKLDVKGKRVVLNIWVREPLHTVMRLRHDIMVSFIGHRWRRAPPCPHIVVLSRSTRHHPRCVTKKGFPSEETSLLKYGFYSKNSLRRDRSDILRRHLVVVRRAQQARFRAGRKDDRGKQV